MADLSTKYLGLTLGNPIVVGSCGITSSVKEIRELEKNGAGAVVLKSLFEEQILREAEYKLKMAEQDDMMYSRYSETLDYIDVHIKERELSDYISLIKNLKKEVLIPVIASVNCVTTQEWTLFARQIQAAGADALELNIFIMPFSLEHSPAETEATYYKILEKVKKEVSIPVAIKLSPYFVNLGQVIRSLDSKGADAVVLFNRFASPDIDIDAMKVVNAGKFRSPSEMNNTLRWIAIMAKRVGCGLAASTGIHDGDSVIKMLLAGATVTQVTSAIYKHGPGYILEMRNRLEDWMDKKGFNYIDQFRGRLSQEKSENPEIFERLQFMKYFSEIA
ncbi:MAG: dihydroorotate dehydrogenase-like protein [Bacteroidales bacterium]|nr:dihydroorotate dehydrogenase-like protein [Bacteroidales bacterium]